MRDWKQGAKKLCLVLFEIIHLRPTPTLELIQSSKSMEKEQYLLGLGGTFCLAASSKMKALFFFFFLC